MLYRHVKCDKIYSVFGTNVYVSVFSTYSQYIVFSHYLVLRHYLVLTHSVLNTD